MIIDVAGYTHVGLVRDTNQDSILIRAEKNKGFFVVVDGMGGHSGGDYASQTTIASLANWWDGGAPQRYTKLEDLTCMCQQEIMNISNYIYAQFSTAHLVGGTTIVAVIADNNRFAILTVGDSHIYRYSDSQMISITDDDVWENQAAVKNSMTPEQIAQDSRCGKLTAAVGAINNVNVHVQYFDQQPEEYLMLCSDGVYKYCGDSALQTGFVSGLVNGAAQQTVANLATYVLDNGAADNFTMAIVRMNKLGNMGVSYRPEQSINVTEPNCNIWVYDSVYELDKPVVPEPVNIEPVAEPIIEDVPEKKEEKVEDEIKVEATDKPSEAKKIPFKFNPRLIVIIVAAILVIVVMAMIISRCSNKTEKSGKDDGDETVLVDESDETAAETIVETEPVPETTIPLETEIQQLSAGMIFVDNPEGITNYAMSSLGWYYGDFDGDTVRDGIEFSFVPVDSGLQLVLSIKDATGNTVEGTTQRLDDIMSQYIEMSVIGLLPNPESNQSTALFATVVNNAGKDYFVIYYAPNGVTNSKFVLILSVSDNNYVVENMYSNIDGVQSVMYPILSGDSSLSLVDQMCHQHLGTEFINISSDQISSGAWSMGTQVIGLVYNTEN